MSQVIDSPEAINEAVGHFLAGEIVTAKRVLSRALNTASPAELAIVAECVRIWGTYPRSARAHFVRLWETNTSDEARRIIEAFAPKLGEAPRHRTPEPESAPKWNRENRYQAPRNGRTRKADPATLRSRRTDRQEEQERRAHNVVSAYAFDDDEGKGRAGYDESRPGDAQSRTEFDVDTDQGSDYASGLDFDRAAVADLRGTPCVYKYCGMERSVHDQRPDLTGRTHDDGLCEECRDKGRTGVPALPQGHTRSAAIVARCAYLAAQLAGRPATLRTRLHGEWYAYRRPEDRAAVSLWVQAHPEVFAEATPEPVSVAPCDRCRSTHRVRKGKCADCRKLPADPQPETVEIPAEAAALVAA